MNYPDGMTLRPINGWPLEFTAQRRRASFKTLFSDTLSQLVRELRHLNNGRRPAPSVLQLALTEADFRLNGMPRANSRPLHPGVILSIEPFRKPALSFPCDTFDDWKDNLRAITLTLEALRKIDRYGVTQTGQQYTGWRAIESKPAVDAVGAACAVLARIAWPNEKDEHQANWAPRIATDPDICRNTIRIARAKSHPDRHNGDRGMWDHVENAIAVLRGAQIAGVD